MTRGIPAAFKAVAACSREDPEILYPETRITPRLVFLDTGAIGYCLLRAEGFDERSESRVVVLHDDLSLTLECYIVLIGIFTRVDSIRVQIILRYEEERSREWMRKLGRRGSFDVAGNEELGESTMEKVGARTAGKASGSKDAGPQIYPLIVLAAATAGLAKYACAFG